MPLDTSKLTPYASYMLYEWAPKKVDLLLRVTRISDLLEELKKAIVKETVSFVADVPLNATNAVGVAMHVRKTSVASWTTDKKVTNVEHHLIVLMEHDGCMGVSVSDPQMRVEVETFLDTQRMLRTMDAQVLQSALMGAGIRTLWLRGAHRKSYYKADSKVLSGPRLESALSLLDDRTFMASSARAATGLPAKHGMPVIGISPDRSYVWIGPTKTAQELCDRFRSLLKLIDIGRKHPADPLPILTQAWTGPLSPGDVFGAFDFEFSSTDTALDLDAAVIQLLDQFQSRVQIDTHGRRDEEFILLVKDRDHANASRPDAAWEITVAIALGTGSATEVLSADSTGWPRWAAFRSLLGRRALWSVWYESRHGLSGGKWTKLDYRASSFDGDFIGVVFDSALWDVAVEKPHVGKAVDWAKIGHDKSLFSWWIKEGMLACFPQFSNAPSTFAYALCDDGSNELGDFIVLARHPTFVTSNNPSDLALIMVHLKAASDSTTRQMAPKRYEEVLGQATKNLGRAHFDEVRDEFLDSATHGKAPFWRWHSKGFRAQLARNSKLQAGSKMEKDIAVFDGRRAHVHVVVVQPHQDANAFKAAMGATPVDFKTRMLCTLLCAAEGAARASSAKLKVIMSA